MKNYELEKHNSATSIYNEEVKNFREELSISGLLPYLRMVVEYFNKTSLTWVH